MSSVSDTGDQPSDAGHQDPHSPPDSHNSSPFDGDPVTTNTAVQADLESPTFSPHGEATLVQRYNRAVMDFIQTANTSDMTELRSEICERMQRRATFQMTNFGRITYGLDEPPPNLFSGFTVSLYLVIFADGRFTFSTAVPGISLGGHIDGDEGTQVLAHVSRGYLQPGLLKQLLELNLTWYDGCLLCEVTDYRRRLSRTVWTMLRVAQEDIVEAGIDTEQHVLLAKYPLLCLDADPEVGRMARTALSDRMRWEPATGERETKIRFVSRRVPEVFVNEESGERHPREVSQDDENAFREKMIARLLAEYK